MKTLKARVLKSVRQWADLGNEPLAWSELKVLLPLLLGCIVVPRLQRYEEWGYRRDEIKEWKADPELYKKELQMWQWERRRARQRRLRAITKPARLAGASLRIVATHLLAPLILTPR